MVNVNWLAIMSLPGGVAVADGTRRNDDGFQGTGGRVAS